MSEHDQDAPGPGPAVIAGESTPPDEHTMRVRAKAAPKEPPTQIKVHDQPEAPPAPEGVQAYQGPSSTQMAEADRRRRRRERDRQAERRALMIGASVFLGLGGAGLAAVNYMVEDPPPTVPPPIDPNAKTKAPPPPPPERPGVFSTEVNEVHNIPALRYMAREGLTIAAEGIPQVDALMAGSEVQGLAAFETCRFAYGVWEFSPNKRFRFLTTCGALEGAVMVGAYEIQGAVVRMSPLISNHGSVVSEFHVKKPSKIKSWVTLKGASAPQLSIVQRVTAIRPGQEGEGFRRTYVGRNTINIRRPPPAPSAPPPSPPSGSKKAKDPLLDLLKGAK